MKNSISIFAILFTLLFSSNNVFAQLRTNLKAEVLALAVERIYLPDNVEVVYRVSNEEIISFEMEVNSNTFKTHVFDALVNNGRYDLNVKKRKNGLEISLPNIHKIVTINNKRYQDTVQLVVYLPSGIKVAQHTPFQNGLLAVR